MGVRVQNYSTSSESEGTTQTHNRRQLRSTRSSKQATPLFESNANVQPSTKQRGQQQQQPKKGPRGDQSQEEGEVMQVKLKGGEVAGGVKEAGAAGTTNNSNIVSCCGGGVCEEAKKSHCNGSGGHDDLLPFLDAEQDHLFLFPEDWHGNSHFSFGCGGFNEACESEITSEIDSLTHETMLCSRRSKRSEDQKMFAGCASDYKVEDVDEILRKAHLRSLQGKGKQQAPLRYTLVKRNPDGKSAHVATEDDVKDLSTLLSEAKVEKSSKSSPPPSNSNSPSSRDYSSSSASAKHRQASHRGQTSNHHVASAAASTTPTKRSGSQYKPGGPCDHCGVTESPQWRRGPPNKPQLCNACGTRYRRTGTLGAGSNASSSSHLSSRKRELSCNKPGKASKEPRLVSVTA